MRVATVRASVAEPPFDHARLSQLSPLYDPQALDDMEFRPVWCTKIVDEGLGVLPDGVDDQIGVFVVSDRFTVPGRL